MTDVLLELGRNPQARRLVRALGLPIPLPEALRRATGPLTDRPLAGLGVVVGAAPRPYGGALGDALEAALTAAGAETLDAGALGEAGRADALLFDATGATDAGALRALYDFFRPLVGRVARSGRVVVLGRPTARLDPAAAAAQAALDGFVRSVAKELGRSGATANLVRVAADAEDRLAPVLWYVLSPRSAFVTGQPLDVTAKARGRVAALPAARSLGGRVALVTGAARGIGAATARALAAEGATVLCLDRPADADAVRALAGELRGTAVLADVTADDAPALVAAAAREAGGLDVLVHNAGITRDRTLARMPPEAWDAVLAVNLAAVSRLTTALEPHLRDGGRIVCLSSVAGLAGNVGQTAYAASKAGVAGWAKAAATRYAERGITVNAVAPGFIETRLTAAMPFAIREVARRLSALGQGGLPEDVAQAVAFLASPGALGLTGRTLRVCGGAYVGA